MHYLKARKFSFDLPTTLRGFRIKIKQLELMLSDLRSTKPELLYGFRLELMFHDTQMNLTQCYEKVMSYPLNEQGIPEGIEIKKRISAEQYITNFKESLDKHKSSIISKGDRNASHPSNTQYRDLVMMLNTAGYSSAKLQKYYIDKDERFRDRRGE